MANDTQQFLDAEDAVNKLLENLQQLKVEVEGYGQAKTTLLEARGQIATVVTSLSQLVEKTGQVIDTSVKIGTPEIINKLDSSRGHLESTTQSVTKTLREMEEKQAEFGKELGILKEELSATSRDVVKTSQAVEEKQAKAAIDILALDRKLSKMLALSAYGLPLAVAVVLAAFFLARKLGF